jgi:hypothetical protein
MSGNFHIIGRLDEKILSVITTSDNMAPQIKRYSVTITERWNMVAVSTTLKNSKHLSSRDRTYLDRVQANADKNGNIDVLYNYIFGDIRLDAPVFMAQISGNIRKLFTSEYMKENYLVFPGDHETLLHIPKDLPVREYNFLVYQLQRQWRSRRAAEVSPYIQGVCAVCNSVATRLRRCGGCKILQYCSKEHQKTHWKTFHRLECPYFYNELYPEQIPLETCTSTGNCCT